MNPVVMHQTNKDLQARTRALLRNQESTPGGNLFNLKDKKDISRTVAVDKGGKLLFRRKSREHSKNRLKPAMS